LTLRAAQRGAKVSGIDVNPQLLEIARLRAKEAGVQRNLELREMGIAELESERTSSYDVVSAGLCLSELTHDELAYTLRQVSRILRPGGLLLVADEVRPRHVAKRVFSCLIRWPLAAMTYLIAQTGTRAIHSLEAMIGAEGLDVEEVRLSCLEDFIELVARKPRR
jgi:demethylmenaquinone methyltransferase/2-methoxy-6-polyprenyl-1,4-benzoquinol methylase